MPLLGVPGYPPVIYPWGYGCEWKGKVVVKTELWQLCTRQRLRCATAEAEIWGDALNVWLLYPPAVGCGVLVWKTCPRAVDQALRQALAELFGPEVPKPSPDPAAETADARKDCE